MSHPVIRRHPNRGTKPTISETAAKFQSILAAELGLEEEQITPDKTWNDLGLDGLDQLEIVMALEEEFKVAIRTEDVELRKTVGQAIDALFELQIACFERKKPAVERIREEGSQTEHEHFGIHSWNRFFADLRGNGILQR